MQIAIVEVNENMPRCLGGSDEYVHINEIDYIIEGANSPVFATPPSPRQPRKNKKLLNISLRKLLTVPVSRLASAHFPPNWQYDADSDLKDLR
jgi:hypothetical protein